MSEMYTVNDSVYAILPGFDDINSSICFFNHLTMSDVKYARIRGIGKFSNAWPLFGSDLTNFWLFIPVKDNFNG